MQHRNIAFVHVLALLAIVDFDWHFPSSIIFKVYSLIYFLISIFTPLSFCTTLVSSILFTFSTGLLLLFHIAPSVLTFLLTSSSSSSTQSSSYLHIWPFYLLIFLFLLIFSTNAQMTASCFSVFKCCAPFYIALITAQSYLFSL